MISGPEHTLVENIVAHFIHNLHWIQGWYRVQKKLLKLQRWIKNQLVFSSDIMLSYALNASDIQKSIEHHNYIYSVYLVMP